MFGTIPPIPPPFRTSSGNPGSPNVNRVDTMPTRLPINTTTTTNVSQSVVDENLPQLLDSRGGSHVTNVPAFDKEDFHDLRLKFNAFQSVKDSSSNALISNHQFQVIDSVVEEDQQDQHEFVGDLMIEQGKCGNGERRKEKSEKGLIAESFDWDDESVSSDDEGSTKIRAFMAIAEDEP
ncbi:hypothetical protein Tco_1367567 [Tanacetum coccineum]